MRIQNAKSFSQLPHISSGRWKFPGIDVATIWSGGEDNLKDGPNFGSFVRPLMSEIEATKPQVAPAVKLLEFEYSATDEAVAPFEITEPAEVVWVSQ